MEALLEVVLPVFLVIGFGYAATWRGFISDSAIDGLMKFAQGFALPCLLFRAISHLDLAKNFDPWLMIAFYSGALAGFLTLLFGARLIFNREWEDCVAIGFCALYSNALLLGLPVTERAYGPDALTANYAIIALHSPFCYGIGITLMEILRSRGGGPVAMAGRILRAMFRNPLVIGISLGLVVNFTGLPLPKMLEDAIDMMTRAALPAALFGLGGILHRYKPEGDMRLIAFAIAICLLLHPTIAYTLGHAFHLTQAQLRSAVITGAMAPGVNAYLFANMYGVGKRVAASTVLFGTACAVLTVWGWLTLLG